MVRVIAGTAKGRSLIAPKGMDTRPITSKIKEALFNILQMQIAGANFLDLFSGSGSMGIEALSRGAKKVVFVEKDRKAIDVIRKNLASCKFTDGYEVYQDDVFKRIGWLAENGYRFDIIYLDPPFTVDEIFLPVMECLSNARLLDKDGCIAIRTRREKEMPEKIGVLRRFKLKNYGISSVHFFRQSCGLENKFKADKVGGIMCKNNLPKIIAIVGTNASGKSALAIQLAKKYNGEIISADSRQIYRGFDLCCGKVTQEEREAIPHHLLDVCNIEDSYSVTDYQKEVYTIIPKIIERKHLPIIVGGTGLYVSSIVNGYEFKDENLDLTYRKELEAKSLSELQQMLPSEVLLRMCENASDFNNKRRIIRTLERLKNGEDLASHNNPRYHTLQLGVAWEKELLNKRIDERLRNRIDQGMLEEVRQYLDEGNPPEVLCNLGLEYRYITWYLIGKYSSYNEFYEELSREIKKFAKRQLTWFKRDRSVHWLDMEHDGFAQACELIELFFDRKEQN